MITLTIPNDDTITLRQFGKALIEIASAKDGHPVDVTITPLVISTDVEERLRAATEELQQAAPQMMDELRFEGEELQGKRKDTTAQQVESLVSTATDFWKAQNPVKMEEMSDVGLDESGAPPTIDSTGTPWDERIHSTSKALNADGTWRLRRKPKDMDELEWSDYVSMIKADLQYPVECGGEGEEIGEPTREEVDELIEASNKMLEPPVTPPGDEESELQPPLYEIAPGHIGVMQDEPPVTPPLPVPPPVVVAPPVTEWDFPRLMTFLTERHGKIDVATVNTLLTQDGMSSVQELNAHPDKIGPFVARVKAHLGE